MSKKASDELLSTIRSIIGEGHTEMDIIRALHMANNDATAAINILLDTPSSAMRIAKPRETFRLRNNLDCRIGNGSGIVEVRGDEKSGCEARKAKPRENTRLRNNLDCGIGNGSEIVDVRGDEEIGGFKNACDVRNAKPQENSGKSKNADCGSGNGRENEKIGVERRGNEGLIGEEWWLVECCEISGMSTCKGRRIKAGDEVIFTFPSPGSGRVAGRGRQVSGCSEIVRFSTESGGEIGRIPNEWARCLLTLVRNKKVRVEGFCKSAPDNLGIMDTVVLSMSVYINISTLKKRHQMSLKGSGNNEESVIHPLPTLFRLLGLTPYKKAEFTPDNLYTRKRPLDTKGVSGLHATMLRATASRSSEVDGNKIENEEVIGDAEIDNIVGIEDSSELKEMDPPSTLQCELRPYQKQALYWMVHLERGHCIDEAATTLHPCWEAYHLADKRDFVVYVNAFSGEATVEFPSTLQMSRGGILADAMGLGKTVMTISLLLVQSEKGGSPSSRITSQSPNESSEPSDGLDASPESLKKMTKNSAFDKIMKQKNLTGGGNLIVCPMTLLSQWKSEIESHAQPGSLSVYVHYGQSRSKDAQLLAQANVVLTTYGVLASEFSAENADDYGGLYSIRWFRVVLDEAHTIKSSKSQISMAATALSAERRWCLTGTPIQNNLEDVYSLLRFLKIEPWGSWAWWNKLIQKPFEEGDERGLKLVQSILKPIMLRRNKNSVDREGRPILVLPPAEMHVIYCELNEAENDFYQALFKKSKVKFDQFVEQGRVLHNYASILELLLRLRQCCDHPFLVMSRSDTQEYADLNKLAKQFLKGGQGAGEGDTKDAPSRAYIEGVVEELRKGEQGECPICLEAFEDAVLTPCAHRLCRECLLASWRNHASGLCPVCRKTVSKQELITAPTDSRFQIDIEKNWVESTKISTLLRELENLRPSGSKSIVFSQWTAFLDLLEIAFTRNNIPFARLDGTLNLQQRERVIKQFSEENNVLVLLLSLKAGGVGINLTAASNAFVMDPWWNPAVEEQAIMRIHRIGQTRSVTIKRFIIKGTVEERMVAVQARKQRMIAGALTDQEVRSARIEELKMLFT